MFKVDATGFMRRPGGVASWSLVVGVLMQLPTNVCQMHMLGPTLNGLSSDGGSAKRELPKR
jgi:hypothetical protein